MRKCLLVLAMIALLAAPAMVLAQTSPATPTATPAVTPSPAASPAPTAKEATTKPVGGNEGGTGGSTSQPGQPQGDCLSGMFGGSQGPIFGIMIVLLVLMFVFSGRSRKKQEAKRKALLDSVKKGDRITTIGGVIGTVVEVRENEVTIRTDEAGNTKLKFARWAIRDVGETSKEGPEEDKK